MIYVKYTIQDIIIRESIVIFIFYLIENNNNQERELFLKEISRSKLWFFFIIKNNIL